MSTESRIKLAARLYQCRDTAKSLFGSEYLSKLKIYINVIRGRMELTGVGEIEAAMQIAKEIQETPSEGMGTVLLMAAAVEIAEPSNL